MSDNRYNENDLTLREILLKAKDIAYEIKAKWYIVLVICAMFIFYFSYVALNTAPKFSASTKFYIEGEGGSGIGGFLGTFGIGGGSMLKNNPLQILEVANSRLLLANVLLSKLDSSNLLINKIIIDYKLGQKWSENNPQYADFTFENIQIDSLNKLEKVALIQVLNLIIKGNKEYPPLRVVDYDKKNAFFDVTTNSLNEEITLALCNSTVRELENHFTVKAIAGYLKTKDILKIKVDSLNTLLTSKMYELNRFRDQNQQLISMELGTKRDLLNRKITTLSMAHAEALKNYELAQFNIENLKTNFVIIDQPFTPLSPQSPSLLIEIFKGLFIGMFLSFLVIVAHKIFRDALN